MISSRPVRILNRLPIDEEPTVRFVGAEAVTIKRYQIGVWISINGETRPFPAVLDLGHSHNLSIAESQLKAFAGLSPARLEFIGTTRLKGERLRQYRADVRFHRNRPGTLELGEGSYRLTIDQGISLAPEGSCRLPLLGLRALVRSGLVIPVPHNHGRLMKEGQVAPPGTGPNPAGRSARTSWFAHQAEASMVVLATRRVRWTS